VLSSLGSVSWYYEVIWPLGAKAQTFGPYPYWFFWYFSKNNIFRNFKSCWVVLAVLNDGIAITALTPSCISIKTIGYLAPFIIWCGNDSTAETTDRFI
jgi:hypothetical protein